MDFNDTPEEAAFRKEVRAWLDAGACAERLATELASFTRALRGWPALFAHAAARGERLLDDAA